MSVRERVSDERQEAFGSYYNTINGPDVPVETQSRMLGSRRITTDIVGNREGANPFMSLWRYSSYPALEGDVYAWWAPDAWLRSFRSYPVQYRPDPPDPRSILGLLSPAELAGYAARILAETSPSKPSVSLPVAIGELRDLPSLVNGFGYQALTKSLRKPSLKKAYESLVAQGTQAVQHAKARGVLGYIRGGASADLTWRFALRPMINDVLALFDFRKAVNNRLRELQNLASKKAIRRRISLGTYESTTTPSYVYVHTQGYGIDGLTSVTVASRLWGTVEWVPLDSDPWMNLPVDRWSDEDKLLEPIFNGFRSYAARSTLGLTSNHAALAAWQLMPWSWLYDWFSPVGDLIAAGGTVGCTFRRLCLMRHSRATRQVDMFPEASDYVSVEGTYDLVSELKERYPLSGLLLLPFPRLPVLNWQQVSILGELALTRALKP